MALGFFFPRGGGGQAERSQQLPGRTKASELPISQASRSLAPFPPRGVRQRAPDATHNVRQHNVPPLRASKWPMTRSALWSARAQTLCSSARRTGRSWREKCACSCTRRYVPLSPGAPADGPPPVRPSARPPMRAPLDSAFWWCSHALCRSLDKAPCTDGGGGGGARTGTKRSPDHFQVPPTHDPRREHEGSFQMADATDPVLGASTCATRSFEDCPGAAGVGSAGGGGGGGQRLHERERGGFLSVDCVTPPAHQHWVEEEVSRSAACRTPAAEPWAYWEPGFVCLSWGSAAGISGGAGTAGKWAIRRCRFSFHPRCHQCCQLSVNVYPPPSGQCGAGGKWGLVAGALSFGVLTHIPTFGVNAGRSQFCGNAGSLIARARHGMGHDGMR